MAKIIMITGGARSGKSKYALKIAKKFKSKKAFLATAVPFDEEMLKRIDNHKKERDRNYETFEESIEISKLIMEINNKYRICIIDCITVYVGNLFHKFGDNETLILEKLNETIESLKIFKGTIVLITNETGLGIIPDNKLARNYRDILGNFNSRVAVIASKVYFLISGIPLKVKG